MSVENDLRELITVGQNLFNTVSTQSKNWNNQIQDKKDEVDKFVSNYTGKVLSHHSSSFKVGGSSNIYYPVVFYIKTSLMSRLELYRNTHTDSKWSGSLRFVVALGRNNWGGSPSVKSVGCFLQEKGHFIHSQSLRGPSNKYVLWLRGNTTYTYNSFGLDLVFANADGTNATGFNGEDDLVFEPISADADGYPKAPFDAQVVPNHI